MRLSNVGENYSTDRNTCFAKRNFTCINGQGMGKSLLSQFYDRVMYDLKDTQFTFMN